jgi:hypothetical protein
MTPVFTTMTPFLPLKLAFGQCDAREALRVDRGDGADRAILKLVAAVTEGRRSLETSRNRPAAQTASMAPYVGTQASGLKRSNGIASELALFVCTRLTRKVGF